jgi:AraC-like DNA-binding protein
MGSSGDLFAHQLSEQNFALKTDPETTATISALFAECYDSFIGGFVTHRLIYCSQVLHHLLGKLFFGNRSFSPRLRTSRFHNIENTLSYLEANVSAKLTLEEMAEHADLSISHFAATFKQQMGFSPIGYFIQLKMQYACSQLTFSNKTIQQIANEVGYTDPYYFSRLFKKVIGLSPQHYRGIS